eukprot:1721235-Prymnesium_polylepis.1
MNSGRTKYRRPRYGDVNAVFCLLILLWSIIHRQCIELRGDRTSEGRIPDSTSVLTLSSVPCRSCPRDVSGETVRMPCPCLLGSLAWDGGRASSLQSFGPV